MHGTRSAESVDIDAYGGLIERWVKRPDGSLEQVLLPLTPERFLNPDIEDRMVQGGPHNLAVTFLQGLLVHYFRTEKSTLVFSDVQLRLGRGLPSPVPDLWVVRGHPQPNFNIRSYSLAKEKVVPCLIVEVVSTAAPLRRVDEVDKVKLYEKVGIRDYLMIELPRRANEGRFRLLGLCLGPEGRYQPMPEDEQSRYLSDATGLKFGVSADGDRLEVFDASTGERLRTLTEEEEARKSAEERAAREEAARHALEEELAHLRAEIDKSHKDG